MPDQEDLLRKLQEESSNLKSLIVHPGWTWLMEIADEQIRNRKNTAFGELENLLEVTKQQFRAGMIGGIELFKLLPSITIEDIAEKIEYITQELEDGRGTDSNDDGELDTGVNGTSDRDFGDFEPPV